MLDQQGKVIGVLVSGVNDAQATYAIPVSAVKRFLSRPEVQFTPPRLGPAALHMPVTFEARVTPLLPSATPLTVDLILKAGNGPEQSARMDANGDRYRLTAVPVPGRSGPVTLRLVARFDDGTSRRRRPIEPSRLAVGRWRSRTCGRSRPGLRRGCPSVKAQRSVDQCPDWMRCRCPWVHRRCRLGWIGRRRWNVSPAGQVERVAVHAAGAPGG